MFFLVSNRSPASGVVAAPAYAPWKPVKADNINYYNLTSDPAPMGEDYRKGVISLGKTTFFFKIISASIDRLCFLWKCIGGTILAKNCAIDPRNGNYCLRFGIVSFTLLDRIGLMLLLFSVDTHSHLCTV